jgi:Leucine-rich repeat (LRR) protein
MGNLKQLLNLYLSYNDFRGRIPAEFGKLRKLTILNLSSNKLSGAGAIPPSIAHLTQLTHLYLHQKSIL